jgi:uncharacterized protein
MKRNPPNSRCGSTPATRAAHARAAKKGRVLGLNSQAFRSQDTCLEPTGSPTWLVQVRDLPQIGIVLSETIPETMVDNLLRSGEGDTSGWRTSGPLAFEIEIKPELQRVTIRGPMDLTLRHDCVRCLKEIEISISLSLNLHLMERDPDQEVAYVLDPQQMGSLIDDSASGEAILDDDEDLVTYQQGEIHLARVLREQILLELPMNPQCRDLGVQAGESCGLEEGKWLKINESVPDPRWAGLQEVGKKLDLAQ